MIITARAIISALRVRLQQTVRDILFGSSSDIWEATAVMMGTIMDVAAVLLIHIDRNHVGNISPSIRLKTDLGIRRRILKRSADKEHIWNDWVYFHKTEIYEYIYYKFGG